MQHLRSMQPLRQASMNWNFLLAKYLVKAFKDQGKLCKLNNKRLKMLLGEYAVQKLLQGCFSLCMYLCLAITMPNQTQCTKP